MAGSKSRVYNDVSDIDFTSEVLFHACALQCNPSSLHQMLVHGGRHSDEGMAKMAMEKSFCLRGCRIGADALANSDYKTLVPLTAHRDILDTAEKQKIILAVTGRVKELRNEASVEAASFCSRKKPELEFTCKERVAGALTQYFKMLQSLY